MDPQATLRELLEAVDDCDWERVEELAEALLSWMARRGFPPLTLGPESLGQDWYRAIATCACHTALAKARNSDAASEEGSD